MPIYKWSKVAASNGNSDPTINYLEGQAPSSINDSARAAMAAEAKFRDDISGTLTTTGSSTAYALTTNSVFDTAALMSGAMITFIPHATNGASPTLAVDGLTARAINQSTGVAVPTGALILGTPYVCTYIHATTEFIIQGVLGIATVNDPLQVLSVDAGATVGPTLDLYRNSASPAVNDVIGSIDFNGKDNGAAKQLYARLSSYIIDPIAATEDGGIILQQVINGALTVVLQSSSAIWSMALGLDVTGNMTVNTNKFTVAAASGNTLAAGTLDATGNFAVNTNKFNVTASSGAVAAAGNIAGAGSFLSSSASGGIGYSTGAGGAVTQATSKATGVTLNAATGAITMNSALMVANALVVFNMLNSTIAANDVLVIQQGAAGTGSFGSYAIQAQCAAGSANISVRNVSAGTLSEAIVLEFAVIKGVVS